MAPPQAQALRVGGDEGPGTARVRPLTPATACAGLLLFAAGIYFVVMASRLIEAPGLQYDEILFVNAATGEATNGMFVAKRILGVPVMLMGYIGALKAYLYYPIFQLFGVSPASIRWPVIGVALLTLGATYAVARRSLGRVASAALTLVIALDPPFMYMTVLDYGPVALMLLLKMTALGFALRAVTGGGSSRDLWAVSAACALGTFDKLNFVWFVLALAIAGAVLFRGELARLYRRDPRGFILPLAALALVMAVAAAVLIVPQLLRSQSAAGDVTLADRIPYVLRLYDRTMNGREFFRFVTGSELEAPSLVNAVSLCGLIAALVGGGVAAWRAGGISRLPMRHRVAGLHLLVFLLIGLQIWITKKAWGPHHLMMLYPLQYLIVFHVAAALARGPGLALVSALLIASNLSVSRAYATAFRPGAEFEPQWSPMINDLVRYLEQRAPDRILSVDWGIHNQVYALGTPHTRVVARDRWPQFRTLGDSAQQARLSQEDVLGGRTLAVLHGSGYDNMPAVRPNFFTWATTAGLRPTLDRTFTSPAGTPIFEVYSLERLRSDPSR
jgi:hypothetical protein